MTNPVNAAYQCPFINGECTKRSHRLTGPYPVCSVWHGQKKPRLITTCPDRFFEADLVGDVIKYCWPGDKPPENPRLVHEVSMEKFGTVDLVVADHDLQHGTIREFVSIELQAVDTTGSVEPAYTGLLNAFKNVDVSYGINWANVRKRYVEQLVQKSFYHHSWGTRMVAVMQTPLYEYFRSHIQFDELATGKGVIDVVFLLYDYAYAKTNTENHSLIFDRAVGTSQNSLMMGALYQQPPPKADFVKRILDRM